MRRLTPTEYQAALVSLFGEGVPNVSDTYPVPLGGYPYSTYADVHLVGETQAEAWLVTAERVAERLAPTPPDCAGISMGACVRAYLVPLANRAFLRPAGSARTPTRTSLS